MRLLNLNAMIGAAAAVMLSPAHAHCRLSNIAVLPVEGDGTQLVTRGILDGRPVRVLVDTGTSVSFLWRPAAERLGLHLISGPRMRMFGLGGETRVDATFIDKFQVQAFTLNHFRLAVAGDVSSRVDFILGEDFLGRHSVEFDLRHRVIRTMDTAGCVPAELPYWSKTYSMAELIGSPMQDRAIRVDVLLNGHRVRAQIDSGSSVTLVTRSVADSAGLQYTGDGPEVVGIGHRSLQSWVADVQSFKLGDESINNTQLRVTQLGKYQIKARTGSRIPVPTGTEPDMLLGMDFLWAHRVLIDETTRKVVFTYEGGPVFQISTPEESDEASPETPGVPSKGN